MSDLATNSPSGYDSEKANAISSPSKPRYGDRFMPTRVGNNWELTFPRYQVTLEEAINSASKIENETLEQNKSSSNQTPGDKKRRYGESDDTVYTRLLKNEILNYDMADMKEVQKNTRNIITPNRINRKLFHFDSAERSGNKNERMSPYSTSPLSQKSKELIVSPHTGRSRVSKDPYKILDAPDLRDDFYLNLLDWSVQGFLGVGLNRSVYLLKLGASRSEAIKLTDYEDPLNQIVTSVVWSNNGDLIGVGTSKGAVEVWDAATQKMLLKRTDHTGRASSLSWNGDILFSGSKDRSICVNDIRQPSVPPMRRLKYHEQEVCGLKWSELNGLLASGGNDNRLNVWDWRGRTYDSPLFTFDDHIAAIKGLDWNPNEHGILASGGGTADRKIRIWNTNLGTCAKVVETGSQICNLVWSKHTQEFVTTHGFIHNEIHVWSYPNIRATTVITTNSHKSRVLYLAISPNGEDIITGAGPPCETLRLWKVFPSTSPKRHFKSAVKLFNIR